MNRKKPGCLVYLILALGLCNLSTSRSLRTLHYHCNDFYRRLYRIRLVQQSAITVLLLILCPVQWPFGSQAILFLMSFHHSKPSYVLNSYTFFIHPSPRRMIHSQMFCTSFIWVCSRPV